MADSNIASILIDGEIVDEGVSKLQNGVVSNDVMKGQRRPNSGKRNEEESLPDCGNETLNDVTCVATLPEESPATFSIAVNDSKQDDCVSTVYVSSPNNGTNVLNISCYSSPSNNSLNNVTVNNWENGANKSENIYENLEKYQNSPRKHASDIKFQIQGWNEANNERKILSESKQIETNDPNVDLTSEAKESLDKTQLYNGAEQESKELQSCDPHCRLETGSALREKQTSGYSALTDLCDRKSMPEVPLNHVNYHRNHQEDSRVSISDQTDREISVEKSEAGTLDDQVSSSLENVPVEAENQLQKKIPFGESESNGTTVSSINENEPILHQLNKQLGEEVERQFETTSNDEKMGEVYEKLILPASIMKPYGADKENHPNNDRRHSNGGNSSPFTTADLLFNNHSVNHQTVTAKKPGRKLSKRGQSVEELLAAVEKLDQAVDHLCEASTVDEIKNSGFRNLSSPNEETVGSKQPDDYFPITAELCQATTSSTPWYSDSVKYANDEEMKETKASEKKVSSEEMSTKPTYSPTTDTKDTNNQVINNFSLINEAVNENCSFPLSSSDENRRSFKRSLSLDDESFYDTSHGSLSTEDDIKSCDYDDSPCTSRSLDEVTDSESAGLVSSMTNVVRRSLRKVKRLRNSFGRGRKGGRESKNSDRKPIENSEESGERMVVPKKPLIGLAGVRSPSTSALLIPSIVASLASPENPSGDSMSLHFETPRETLTPPPSTPNQRRDSSRSGLLSSCLPPLSPTYRILSNVTTEPITSESASNAPVSSRSTRTLPNSSSSTRGTNAAISDTVSQNPEGISELGLRISANQHSRSSSVPNGSSIDGSSSNVSSGHEAAFHTDVSSILISPARLPRVTALNRNSSPNSRHGNNRRRPRNHASRSNRRNQTDDENRNLISRRGSRTPVSPTHSTSSGGTTRPAVATVSEVVAEAASSRPRACSRSTESSVTIITDVENSRGNENNANGQQSSTASQQVRRRTSGYKEELNDCWSHHHSGLMASLSVTVTVFNISRFAVLGAEFGWPFLVQWAVASLVLGLPLLTLHASLGQHTGLGALQMWKIAPIFQGVGISLIAAQLVLGIYCSIPVAWLFVYFRDSFITQNNAYIWAWCRRSIANCTEKNISQVITQSIPAYLSSDVQQKSIHGSWQENLGSLKVNLILNIVLIFLITIFALCRGNKIYGKISYIIFILPLLCFLIVCLYIASLTQDDLTYVPNVLRSFICRKSWVAASREVFLVWGLHGPVLQQMTAFNRRGQGVRGHIWLLTITTMLVLIMAAVTGSCCAAALRRAGLVNTPSSFENPEYAQFLSSAPPETTKPFMYEETPTRTHYYVDNFETGNLNIHQGCLSSNQHRYDSLYTGIRICPELSSCNCNGDFQYGFDSLKGANPSRCKNEEREDGEFVDPSEVPKMRPRSGYQSLRLATELFPAFLGIHGVRRMSPFWSSLFYFSLLLFGLGQQLAVWRTIIEVIISGAGLQKKRGLVTVCCCLMGLSAALPLATEMGPDLLFFLDYIIGCGWWLMILQLIQVFAILFVRGKPMSALDLITTSLGGRHNVNQTRNIYVHITAFSCSILVPVGLLVLSVSTFQSGHYKEVFTWTRNGYWPIWVSQLASGLQLLPILLVPVVALAQTCRYLANTNYDVYERVQRLYRPDYSPRSNCYRRARTSVATTSSRRNSSDDSEGDPAYIPTNGAPSLPFSDPPPKYTPPPSYSTATGNGIAKALNQSFRRSMRHIRDSFRNGSSLSPRSNEDSICQGRDQNSLAPTNEALSPIWTTQFQPYIPTPDYVNATGAGLTHPNNETLVPSDLGETPNNYPPPLYSTLDPLNRKRVLKVLQKAGIRRGSGRSVSSEDRVNSADVNGVRESDQNNQVPSSVRNDDTSLELRGFDHLAFEHEDV